METQKLDDFTMQVTLADEEQNQVTFTIAGLKQQRLAIENQMEKQIKQRNKELVEVDNYLLEMDKLGIKEVEDDNIEV